MKKIVLLVFFNSILWCPLLFSGNTSVAIRPELYIINSEDPRCCYEAEIVMPGALTPRPEKNSEFRYFRLKTHKDSLVFISFFSCPEKFYPASLQALVYATVFVPDTNIEGELAKLEDSKFPGYQLVVSRDIPGFGRIKIIQGFVWVSDSLMVGITVGCNDQSASMRVFHELYAAVKGMKLRKIDKALIPAGAALNDVDNPRVSESALYEKFADYFFRAKNYEAAVKYFSKAIDVNPDEAKLYHYRGLAYESCKQHASAIKDYDKAIALKPDAPEVHYSLGNIYNTLGNYDSALKNINQTLAHKPDHGKAYYLRGLIYSNRRQYKSAIDDFSKAIEHGENHFLAYYSRGGAYYRAGEYDAAVKDFETCIRLNPNDHDVYFNIGVIFYKRGRYDSSIEKSTRALELKPNMITALNLRANAYFKTKQYEKAIPDYIACRSLKPDQYDVCYNLGNAYRNVGQYNKAIQAYNKTIELKSDFPSAFYRRAQTLCKIGELAKAITDYIKVIELQPKGVVAYLNVMELLLITGKTDEAEKWRKKLEETIPADKLSASDQVLIAYFNGLIRIIKNESTTQEEGKLNNLLKNAVKLDWNFELTDSWLKDAKNGLSKAQIDKIRTLSDKLKATQKKE